MLFIDCTDMNLRFFYLTVILATGLLNACSSGTDCHQLVQSKCLGCHNLTSTCKKIGASEKQWLQTIDAMIKLQADISLQERTALATCLSRADKSGIRTLCTAP